MKIIQSYRGGFLYYSCEPTCRVEILMEGVRSKLINTTKESTRELDTVAETKQDVKLPCPLSLRLVQWC